MIFWAVVLGVIGLVLVLAWRRDRKRKETIRRSSAVERDIGHASYYNHGTNFPDAPGGV
jgi:hypothetical protein